MAVIEDLGFDGFEGKLARPDQPSASPLPGILVMPDAYGISDFSIGQAARLADLGFVALAGDPYGGGFHASNPDEIAEKFASVAGDVLLRRTSARTWTRSPRSTASTPTRLGAIGYCLGGTAVLELARSGYSCRGVVSFHGLLTTASPAARDAVIASVLVCTGADDPYAPLSDVAGFQAEMTDAGVDCQVIVYSGTLHSFTNPESHAGIPGIAFHPQNAERSWNAMVAFLHERVGVPALV